MTETKLIHAFTAPGADAPPYINIGRMADGSVRVIVRGTVYPNGSSGTEEIILSAADWRSIVASAVSEGENVKHMVDRFLGWKLPENFSPDGGVRFEPTFNNGTAVGGKHEPVGTNLLTASQADAMIRHMLEVAPTT